MDLGDPLDYWLVILHDIEGYSNGEALGRTRRSLDLLAKLLAGTPARRKPDYYRSAHGLGGRQVWPAVLPPDDLSRAEELCRELLRRGGTGQAMVQEALIFLAGMAASPASLPFWEELLDLRRQRDGSAVKRRTYALAALALLVIEHGEPRAVAVLRTALKHPNPETRAMAAYYLGRAFEGIQGPVPGEVVDDLTTTATRDRSFEPSFMVRRVLSALDRPLSPEHPKGSFTCKVWHTRDETVHRMIEVSSMQTLDHLHAAIQDAWGWNDDHPYSFYLNNKRYDARYELAHDDSEDVPAYASEARIGDLGLTRRHRFMYLFDFGDNHEFTVVVTAIQPEADTRDLPRVIEAIGDPMPQYTSEW